jgi:O-antigen/teichoic acid export membrane protein
MLFVLLARFWGPSDLGLFSFVFGVSMLLILIVDFGFASYLLREIGAEPSCLARIFRAGLRAKIALILPFGMISTFVIWIYGSSMPWQLSLPMLMSALLLSFSEYCIAPLRALGRYDLETAVLTASNLINFVVAATFAWLGGTPVDVAWVSVLSRVQYFVTAAWVLHRVAPEIKRYQNAPASTLQTLGRVLPYGGDGLLSACWNQLDVVVVGTIFGTHTLGIYAAGQKIVQGLYTLAQVVGNVMIPRLARLAHTRSQEIIHSAPKAIRALSVVGFVLAVPLWLVPGLVSNTLFGGRFSELAGLLPLFAIILILRYISGGSGVVMTAIGKQKSRVKFQALGIATFLLGALFTATVFKTVPSLIIAYATGLVAIAAAFHLEWKRFASELSQELTTSTQH